MSVDIKTIFKVGDRVMYNKNTGGGAYSGTIKRFAETGVVYVDGTVLWSNKILVEIQKDNGDVEWVKEDLVWFYCSNSIQESSFLKAFRRFMEIT